MQKVERSILICTWYMWMKFVDCTSLQVYPEMICWRFYLYLRGERNWHGIGYVMILEHGTGTDWNWNFIRNFILCIWFIVIGIIYIIFSLVKEKVSLKLGGGLSTWCTDTPIMSSLEKLSYGIFMLDFLIMINPCSILLLLVPLWIKLLNSNGIF